MADDPYASLIDDCHCSASQSSLLDRTPFVRQHDFPHSPFSSSSPAVPAASSPDRATGIIGIRSAPETPAHNNNKKKDDGEDGGGDEERRVEDDVFETPPEENNTRVVSSSQVSAASAASMFAGWSKSDGEARIGVVEEEVESCVPIVGEKLGFVVLKRGELVEVVEDGKVKAREVDVGVLERFRGGRKREFDGDEPRWIESPLKRMKASDEGDKDEDGDDDGSRVNDDVECTQELDIGMESDSEEEVEEEAEEEEEEEEFSEEDEVSSVKKKLESCEANDLKSEDDRKSETEKIDGNETEDNDVDDDGCALANDVIDDNDDVEECSSGETERIEAIIEQGEEPMSMIREMENGETEKEDVVADENGSENWQDGREVVVAEKADDNGHSVKESVVASNAQNKFINDQGEMEVDAEQESLVASSGIRKSNNRNVDGDRERVAVKSEISDENYKGGMSIILKALKVLAEEMPNSHVSDVDIYETAKRCGMTFPRPKWWDNVIGNEVLED